MSDFVVPNLNLNYAFRIDLIYLEQSYKNKLPLNFDTILSIIYKFFLYLLLRAVNNRILDNYQLKSQDAFLGMIAEADSALIITSTVM